MANAAAIGYLELNIKGFEQALTTAKRALTVFAAGMAAMKGMEFLKDGVKDAINFGNAMHHASQAAGRMDPGSFLVIQKAIENIGMSAEGAQAAIKDFVETGRPIQSIFGNAGNYTKALENATQQYGAQAKILSENASKFSKVFELIQAVGGKIREFFLSMSAQFLKPLQVLLETLNRIDLAKIGEEFGAQFARAVNILNGALVNNSLGDIISTGFALGSEYLKNAFNHLMDVLGAGATALGIAIDSVIVSINWGNVGILIVNTLGKGLITAFEFLIRGLTKIFGWLIEGIAALIDKLPGVSGVLTGIEADNESLQAQLAGIFDTWRTGFEGGSLTNTDTSQIAPIIKMALSDAMSSLGELSDSPEARALKGQLAALASAAEKSGAALAKSAPEKLTGYAGMKADPYSVIADSMAKIGGGGGAMRVGMTIEEKQLFEQKNATRILIDIKTKMSEKKAGFFDLPTMREGVA